MDGIGDGSYGWLVDDVGGMEDIDGKCGVKMGWLIWIGSRILKRLKLRDVSYFFV